MNSSTRRAWLPGILAVALLIRLLLFSGIQGNDDAIYYSGALRISRGEPLPQDDLLQTRVGYVAPLAVLFRVLGPGLLGLTALPLLVSLGLVSLAYLLGRDRYGERVGRGAALILAVFPLDVAYATQLNTDGALALWLGLAAWLLGRVPSATSPAGRTSHAVLAGLCLGMAHLTKESALPLSLFLVPILAGRDRLRCLLTAGVTLAGVVGIEALAYQVWTGDALHRVHLAHTYQAGTEKGHFFDRLLVMPLLCFNPLGIAFPYTGGLFALSAAGCAWAVARDRARSSGLAMWWLGSGLLLALAPLSLFPYQPAVRLHRGCSPF